MSRYRFWAAQFLRMLSDALSTGPTQKMTGFPQPQLNRNGDEFEVGCRKGVAPYILDVESTRRFSGALVHDLQALFSASKKIIFSPLPQGDDHGEQLAALLG